MSDVEVIPTINKELTATNDKEQSQATFHDSVLNTSMSQDEILALKRKN